MLRGLEPLESPSHGQFDVSFRGGTAAQPERPLFGAAFGEFLVRFCYLTTGAFYATQVGTDDIGYIGNSPITGASPIPSNKAEAHLQEVLPSTKLQRSARRLNGKQGYCPETFRRR